MNKTSIKTQNHAHQIGRLFAVFALSLASAGVHASTLWSLATGQSDIIMQFDFKGEFTMTDPTGEEMKQPKDVSGTMALAFDVSINGLAGGSLTGPYDGLAAMEGGPFFNEYWDTDGTMIGFQNLIGNNAPEHCGDHDMCADAELIFRWGVNDIPVEASFALDMNSSISFPEVLTIKSLFDFKKEVLDAWANRTAVFFDVSSLDKDGDTRPGTPLETVFPGFTPSFIGVATITGMCTGKLDTSPDVCVAEAVVPVPAAVWLFCSGLFGLLGITGRKRK